MAVRLCVRSDRLVNCPGFTTSFTLGHWLQLLPTTMMDKQYRSYMDGWYYPCSLDAQVHKQLMNHSSGWGGRKGWIIVPINLFVQCLLLLPAFWLSQEAPHTNTHAHTLFYTDNGPNQITTSPHEQSQHLFRELGWTFLRTSLAVVCLFSGLVIRESAWVMRCSFLNDRLITRRSCWTYKHQVKKLVLVCALVCVRSSSCSAIQDELPLDVFWKRQQLTWWLRTLLFFSLGNNGIITAKLNILISPCRAVNVFRVAVCGIVW